MSTENQHDEIILQHCCSRDGPCCVCHTAYNELLQHTSPTTPNTWCSQTQNYLPTLSTSIQAYTQCIPSHILSQTQFTTIFTITSKTLTMASSTMGPTFSFHHLPSPHPLHHPTKIPKLPLSLLPKPNPKLSFAISSLDVTKDDKPLNNSEDLIEDTEEKEEEEYPLLSRRTEEKFAVLNTGISECRSCGYLYDETAGDPAYPIPPGMQFGKLPEDWRCPTCGAAKSFFRSKSVEVAGFAENK